MTKLISLLQGQHRGIENRVKSIQAAVEAKDAARIYVELPMFRAGVVSHLKLEDTELYPGIARIAQELGDASLAAIAQTFAHSMKQISEGLGAILSRHDHRQIDLPVFTRDWASVSGLLASRIRSEEDRLYGMYEASCQRRDKLDASRRETSRAPVR